MHANLIEWAHMTAYSDSVNITTPRVQRQRQRAYASQIGKEIYWHHLSILDYKTLYNLTLEGWHGVVSNVTIRAVPSSPGSQNPYGFTIHGDGQYSDHVPDLGTKNALFVEDSKFYN